MGNTMYDIIVVGAGPAGLTAAIYARRAGKSVLILEKETFGGQMTHSPKIENYPGYAMVSGNELADSLVSQALGQGADIELDEVKHIERREDGIVEVTGADGCYEGLSVILATGSKHRTLGLPKEEDFEGRGISYCAVCDGAFYKGQKVAVIGGGNSALQAAVMLSEYCREVVIVQNLSFLTGEQQLSDILHKRSNVSFIYDTVVRQILGTDRFWGLALKKNDGTESELQVDGVFVTIGQVPQNQPFVDLVGVNSYGYFDVGEECRTEKEWVFVAGDCRSKRIRQITTATGDGAVAAIAACQYVDSIKNR